MFDSNFYNASGGPALALCLFFAAVFSPCPSRAVDLTRPDSHAPIGVMGEHIHHEGELMVSYRYMRMRMDGHRDGTDKMSQNDLLISGGGVWPVAPNDMDMEMHMVGLMYAPRDALTLMLMVPFVQKSMDHTTAMGADFTTRSSGIGDISLTGLIKFFENDMHEAHLNVGLSLPTGTLSRKDETPASSGNDVILPYPMQIGSGTLDLLPGVTYVGQKDALAWGGQLRGTVRLGRNNQNYRLGNQYALTGWGTYKAFDWLSGGLRMQYRQWFNIVGSDGRIKGLPMFTAETTVPTADPGRQAGRQLEFGPSVNFLTKSGPLKGVRLGFEVLFPLFRHLDGPQLETDWTLTAGIQYAF